MGLHLQDNKTFKTSCVVASIVLDNYERNIKKGENFIKKRLELVFAGQRGIIKNIFTSCTLCRKDDSMVRSMTSGNPIRLILAFTVPLLIGNVFQQFYNIADIIIVGRTIGVNALAAVGAVAPVFMAVFGLTIGLSSGFSVITGQRFGAEDMDGVRRSVTTSAMLALALTLLLTLGVSLAMPLIMRLMNISDVYTTMPIIICSSSSSAWWP